MRKLIGFSISLNGVSESQFSENLAYTQSWWKLGYGFNEPVHRFSESVTRATYSVKLTCSLAGFIKLTPSLSCSSTETWMCQSDKARLFLEELVDFEAQILRRNLSRERVIRPRFDDSLMNILMSDSSTVFFCTIIYLNNSLFLAIGYDTTYALSLEHERTRNEQSAVQYASSSFFTNHFPSQRQFRWPSLQPDCGGGGPVHPASTFCPIVLAKKAYWLENCDWPHQIPNLTPIFWEKLADLNSLSLAAAMVAHCLIKNTWYYLPQYRFIFGKSCLSNSTGKKMAFRVFILWPW